MEINKKNDTTISSSLSSSPHKGGFIRNLIPGFIDAGAGTAYVPKTMTAATATTDMIPDITSVNETASNNNKKDATDAIVANDVEINDDANDDVEIEVSDDVKNSYRNEVIHDDDTFSEAATELHDNRTTSSSSSNSAALSKRYHSVQSKSVQPGNTNRNKNNNNDNESDNEEKRGDSDNDKVGDNIGIEVEAKYGFFPSTKPPPSPRPSSFLGGVVAVKDIDAGSDSDKIIINTDDDDRTTEKTLPSPRPISPPHVTRKKLGVVKRSSSTAAVVEDEESRSQNHSLLVAKIKSSQVNNAVDDGNENQNDDDESDSNNISSSNIDRSGDSDNNVSQSALNLTEKEEEERLYPFPPPRQQTQTEKQQYQPDRSLQRPLPFLMKREVSTFSLAPEIGAVVDQEEHQDKLLRWKIKERSQNEEYQKSKNDNDDDDDDTTQQQEQEQDQQTQDQNQRQRIEEMGDRTEMEDQLLNKISGNNRRLDKIALQEKDRIEGQQMGGFDSFTNAVFQIKREQDKNDKNNNNDDDDRQDEDEENEILSSSEVSSTCSEFGTVIQMGDAAIAARLADIEEMELAALADLREEEGEGEGKEVEEREDGIKSDVKGNVGQGGALAHLSSSSLLQCRTSLDLPIIESRSFGQDDTVAITATATPIIINKKSSIQSLHPRREEKQKQQSSSSDEESRTIQHDRTSVKIDNNYYDKDAKTMTTSANAAISPNKRKPTASEMVSAAFRRIGPIHSLNKSHGIQNSLSAPTTPPPSHWQKRQSLGSSFEDCERNLARDGRNKDTPAGTVPPPPPSFVLRSPGSSARISLDAHQVLRMRRQRYDRGVVDQSRTVLSPRFSSLLRGRGKGGTTSAITEIPTTDPSAASLPSIPLSPRKAITLPFQLAQKCFSYDNTFSDYSVDDYEYEDNFENDDNIDERRRKLRERLDIPHLGRSTVSQLTPRVFPLESSLSFGGTESEVGYSSGIQRHYKSFDQGTTSHDFSGTMGGKSELLSRQQRQQKQRSPFRQPVSSRKQGYRFLPHHFPADTDIAAISEPSTVVDLRGRSYSDFSPTKYSKNSTLALNSTMELQTPQRIEIEREDALDILACLVERGIADWKTPIVDSAFATTTTQKTDASVTSSDDQSKNEDSKHVVISSDATQGTALPSLSSPTVGDIMKTEKEEKTEDDLSQISPGLRYGMETGDEIDNVRSGIDSALFRIIEDFRKWSQEHDDVARQHSRRMKILDELFKSHAYAVEMKRAASSASTWLKSIGRGQTVSNHNVLGDDDEIRGGELTTAIIDAIGAKDNDKKLNSNKTIDKMEMMTLKATLHSTQLALTETKQVNTNLNEELSKCRAEIGRMKSISRNEQLNRSILDDPHNAEGSSISASSVDCRDERLFQGVSEEDAKERIESAGELDVLVLKSALEKANETIRRLHGELHKDAVKMGEEIEPTPVVDIPDIQVKPTRSQSIATTPDSSPDHRTVNVRMLDGENFVTDWNDLRTLPPPPDHGLQSPIVRAVLEQWTPDRSLHESLLSWIEEVMKGDDLEGLPPLTISSLDHQVRDGFSMHVLPHLLRRADIHVAVKTRAHRRTTYDMSVTVSQKNQFVMGLSEVPISSSLLALQQPGATLQQQQWSLLDRRDSQSEDEWARRSESRPSSNESVAHSAVTETIANLPYESQGQPPHTPIQTPRRSPELSPMEYRNFASQLRSRSGSADTFDESLPFRQRQHDHQQILPSSSGTIMGALGGALSGLLSRNKYAASPGRVQSQNDRESSNMLPASLRAQMDLTSSPVPGSSGYHRVGNLESTVSADIDDQQQQEDLLQPYHRVVSAPPGRIGVTFVEFRGHAMVSDVAMDSPLAGWVFPSDILIAVDEIPVSGMRVRDIVKILSTRKDRQRAMRVISSHDMNEFTMMNQLDGSLSEANGEGK